MFSDAPSGVRLSYWPERVVKRAAMNLTCHVDDPGRPSNTTFRFLSMLNNVYLLNIILLNFNYEYVNLFDVQNSALCPYNHTVTSPN